MYSSFEINLPLKIACSGKKTSDIFTIVSNEITQKTKNHVFLCWSNKLKFVVFLLRNCLSWLDLVRMVRQKRSTNFLPTLITFFAKLDKTEHSYFLKKTENLQNFKLFWSSRFQSKNNFCVTKTTFLNKKVWFTKFAIFSKILIFYWL